ncbi:collagen-like protein [Kribbella sp. NPDC005582]|uniref:collagen-like triple helix repeat-containing protein n=1 Tax=Kribbella sp. NPDC005582 TaxID=3156893 RepID=UPI0033B3BF87
MNRGRIAGIVVAVGLIGAGSIAYAAIPDPAGVIHGCYNKGGLLQDKGNLRVVEAGEKCRATELAMTWNHTGPQGPAGPVGATGEPGATGAPGQQGATGPAGPSDSYEVKVTQVLLTTTTQVAELDLPAGTYLLMGKADLINRDDTVQPASCSIEYDYSYTYLPSGKALGSESLTVTSQTRLEVPQKVRMLCDGYNVAAEQVKFTALKVGQIHFQ